jgi:hypothetical protein
MPPSSLDLGDALLPATQNTLLSVRPWKIELCAIPGLFALFFGLSWKPVLIHQVFQNTVSYPCWRQQKHSLDTWLLFRVCLFMFIDVVQCGHLSKCQGPLSQELWVLGKPLPLVGRAWSVFLIIALLKFHVFSLREASKPELGEEYSTLYFLPRFLWNLSMSRGFVGGVVSCYCKNVLNFGLRKLAFLKRKWFF